MKGNRLRVVECETDAKYHFFSFPFMCSAKIHHWRWFHPWMLYSNFIVKSTILNFISACSLISSSTILLQNKSQTIHRHEIVNGNNGLTKQRLDSFKAPLKIFYAELYSLLTLICFSRSYPSVPVDWKQINIIPWLHLMYIPTMDQSPWHVFILHFYSRSSALTSIYTCLTRICCVISWFGWKFMEWWNS